MFCTNCGTQVGDGSAFCPNCGTKFTNDGMGVPVQGRSNVKRLVLLNIDYVPGKEVEVLGLVKGSSTQARNVGKDLMAGFKNMVGGELDSYTEMVEATRKKATDVMMKEAESLGADAILNVRYTSVSPSVQGVVEVTAYGTAVIIKE